MLHLHPPPPVSSLTQQLASSPLLSSRTVFYKDLEANSIIDDLIIFPGDATFTKAAPRVHVLKFNSSSARSFFWHQDVDESQDDERAKKVNELIGGQVEEEEENSGAMEVEG